MVFVVAKIVNENSSGSKIIKNSPLEEVAAATSSSLGFVIPAQAGTQYIKVSACAEMAPMVLGENQHE